MSEKNNYCCHQLKELGTSGNLFQRNCSQESRMHYADLIKKKPLPSHYVRDMTLMHPRSVKWRNPSNLRSRQVNLDLTHILQTTTKSKQLNPQQLNYLSVPCHISSETKVAQTYEDPYLVKTQELKVIPVHSKYGSFAPQALPKKGKKQRDLTSTNTLNLRDASLQTKSTFNETTDKKSSRFSFGFVQPGSWSSLQTSRKNCSIRIYSDNQSRVDSQLDQNSFQNTPSRNSAVHYYHIHWKKTISKINKPSPKMSQLQEIELFKQDERSLRQHSSPWRDKIREQCKAVKEERKKLMRNFALSQYEGGGENNVRRSILDVIKSHKF